MYTYYAAIVISNYWKQQCKNEYTVDDAQSFSEELLTLSPLEENEEYVSYDVESLFTSIQVDETTGWLT